MEARTVEALRAIRQRNERQETYMGRTPQQQESEGDIGTRVEEIDRTADRLAAAVEALAFK